jgi:organic radical activating enzyme
MKCAWIENMMSIETDGWTRPCCLETSDAARISPIQDGILTAFNHTRLIDLRDNLKNGYSIKTKHACNRCEQLERRGQDSMRTNTQFVSATRELKVLQFKMSNKCQLACAHCGPDRSSTWRKLLDIQPRVLDAFEVTDEFLEELVEVLPNLEVLKFSGGEPFLDPNHWKILDYLKNFNRRHCKLQYITNGLVKPRYDLWEGWGSVECSVSADGFEETFEWFRRGAQWEELVHSVAELENYSEVNINYAITPYTIHSWDSANEFWKYKIGNYLVVYPNTSSLFEFPKQLLKETDPFYSSAANVGDIRFYQNWATSWDNRWNTPGWSNRLFNWMDQ